MSEFITQEEVVTEIKNKDEKSIDTVVDVSEMYTPLSVAREEVWRRWNDKELRKKVEDFLGDVPEIFKDEPRAVLFRNIATPNLEFKRFFEMAEKTGLKQACMEYQNDRFCTRNQDKIHLVRLDFLKGTDKNGNKIINRKKIVNSQTEDNKPFGDIHTKGGKKLVDLHHEMLGDFLKKIDLENISNWLKEKGDGIDSFYQYVLALFVCHGIFFESFFVTNNEDERIFTSDIIIPAFRDITKRFGLKPIIVSLFSEDEERASDIYYWDCYDETTDDNVS